MVKSTDQDDYLLIKLTSTELDLDLDPDVSFMGQCPM